MGIILGGGVGAVEANGLASGKKISPISTQLPTQQLPSHQMRSLVLPVSPGPLVRDACRLFSPVAEEIFDPSRDTHYGSCCLPFSALVRTGLKATRGRLQPPTDNNRRKNQLSILTSLDNPQLLPIAGGCTLALRDSNLLVHAGLGSGFPGKCAGWEALGDATLFRCCEMRNAWVCEAEHRRQLQEGPLLFCPASKVG